MTDPVVAQKGPYEVTVEGGRKYAWCRCGLSKTQPFCDGSHTATELRPIVWTAAEDATIYLCGCKRSGNKPYCDGTHSTF